MTKENLKDMISKEVENVWYGRRSLNPVKEQTELLTDAIWASPPCPSCKGTNTILKQIFGNNGILGPGGASWVIDSWYSCQDCGTRFDLIKK